MKHLMLICILALSCEAFATFSNNSCVAIPSPTTDNDLRGNTAYGYIIQSISMTDITDACDASDPNFKFCLKNPDNTTPDCKPITMQIGESKTLGDMSTSPELGGNLGLQSIVLTVEQIGQLICLTMPTSRGSLPIACKGTTTPPPPSPVNPDNTCSPIGLSCYGASKSQSLFNFSGVAVNCLKDTLDKVFFQYNSCQPSDMALTSLNSFSAFQESLKTSIRAALIIYVMFYGFKVVLNHEYLKLDKVVALILKFLFISYFAVGLGPVIFQDGKSTTKNGMVEFGLPFLTSVTSDFAYMVFSSGGSKGLCEFDLSKYQNGYSYFGLWDAVDCRIGYYLGMQILYNMSSVLSTLLGSTNTSNSTGSSAINLGTEGKDGVEALNIVGGLTFFTVMFGFFMAGNIIIVICGLAFSIIFISIILHFIGSYLVCLITLYVMAYISPIFITMALFERTKSYFDSWLKVTLSCALQPAVLAGFIALLLTMYDSAIYNNCQFQRHDYTLGDVNFSTFELREPASDPSSCQDSAGYKLLKYYTGQGWSNSPAMLFRIYAIKDIFSLMVNMLYVFVFTYIFYHFSKSFSQFAADITGGPIMDAVVVSPQKGVQLAYKAAKFAKDVAVAAATQDPNAAKDAAKSGKDLADEAGKAKTDEGGGDGGGAGAGGEGGAGDKISDTADKVGGAGGGAGA